MARAVLVVRIPALPHHLLAGDLALATSALEALLARAPNGVFDGERVTIAFDGPGDAVDAGLALVASKVAGQGIGASVGSGDLVDVAGVLVGAEAYRARRLCDVARVGEVLLTDAVDVTLPDGVGVFAAPTPLSAAVGFAVRVLRDYR